VESRWPSAATVKSARIRQAPRTQTAAGAMALGLTLLLSCALALGVLVSLAAHHHIGSFALDHRSLLVAAGGIAVLAGAIASTLTAALRS
jgi:hypothetical protein